jgi:hypothetical protein
LAAQCQSVLANIGFLEIYLNGRLRVEFVGDEAKDLLVYKFSEYQVKVLWN